MGVNTLEIMPIAEFPGGYSWGYNPAHPFAVESEYGGPVGLKELVKAAHAKGIAILLDVVYNHFGPTDMDIWQFDGWSENGLGGIYFYNDWRAKTPWGETRPDYGRSEVRQYIFDNALMWLEKYRIDGLRMDMIPYIRNVNADGNPANGLQEGYSLMQWINSEIKNRFPQKFTIAEDLHTLNVITAPIEEGGLCYSSQWDAQFVNPIRHAIISMNDEDRDMNAVAGAILHTYYNSAFQRVIYTESHDEVSNGKARVVQEIAGRDDVNTWYAKKRSTLGATLMMTSPGVPMLFQGQTVLEDKWFDDTDPIDWSRFSEFKGFVKLYRDLIQLRRNISATTRGLTGQHVEILHVDNEKKIIAFHRWMDGGAGDSTVVVLNFSHQAVIDYVVKFPGEGIWKIRFNCDWEAYDTEFQNHFSYDTEATALQNEGLFTANVSLGAYSSLIYSQD
ncbi:alpha-amylase family glycosyl hydrolase [Runella sp.]|uniref:alpha-amylase family glycosyl hydrolase n=1 Tax=Runella sp. TaxID=1960881 RepID=UPI0026037CBB|nr:alpha-amylase family glycosyl hydrolase [Runella sp.]